LPPEAATLVVRLQTACSIGNGPASGVRGGDAFSYSSQRPPGVTNPATDHLSLPFAPALAIRLAGQFAGYYNSGRSEGPSQTARFTVAIRGIF